MTTSSRFLAALTYLTWIPTFLVLTNPPEGWDGKEHFEQFISHLISIPVLVLSLGLLCIWREFERDHWIRAVGISTAHSVFSFMILLLGCALCVIIGPGLIFALVVVYIVLPIILFSGWTFQLALAIHALAGGGAIGSLRHLSDWIDTSGTQASDQSQTVT